jgi:hypothetical protein
VENFFKIPTFTLNFQKTVLFQAINYSLDRTSKEVQEQVYLKFQFWVLKLTNKNISGDLNNPPISSEELNQSLNSLSNIISNKVNNTFNTNLNFKCFFLKTAYELGYYYYLINDYPKMGEYFSILLNKFNYEKGDPNFNTIYFNKDDIELFLNFNELDDDYENLTQSGQDDNVEMRDSRFDHCTLLKLNENDLTVENDYEKFFKNISSGLQEKIILDVSLM